MMAPFDLVENFGKYGSYVIYFLIGIGFGSVLELSGFGDSRRLAAQFYLKEMRVLKVMFTAIIVAMVLIYLSSAIGILDFSRVWVNPTYLVPGIVGGLLMGVGFIVGGFCPGTSMVGAVTFKIDALVFVLGVTFGIFLFGETIVFFSDWWNSTYLGRLTIYDALSINAGIVVVLVLIMAFGMFYGAEVCELIFGKGKKISDINWIPRNRFKLIFAGSLFLLGLITLFVGQPNLDRKWDLTKSAHLSKIEKREIYVSPEEVVSWFANRQVYVRTYDFRLESDYNLFHLPEAYNVSLDQIMIRSFYTKLAEIPSNTVIFLTSYDESLATVAWKRLTAAGVPNVYIIEGGMNAWLKHFPLDLKIAVPRKMERTGCMQYQFSKAVGGTIGIDTLHTKRNIVKKVKLQTKKAVAGGCG